MLRSLPFHRRAAYSRVIWNSRHFYLILGTIIWIVGTGFCCTLKSSPYEDALCSKASNENALILTYFTLSNELEN